MMRLDGFTLEIIDDPARTLGLATEPVLEVLNRLCRENLASDPGSYLLKHFTGASTLILVRRDDAVVGMSLASLSESEGTHYLWVRLTVLDPRARGAMFMQRVTGVHLWRAALAAWPRRFFLLTRTANPRVVGSLLAAPQFYPRPDRPTPTALREAAITFCRIQHCLDIFDAEALVLRQAVSQADDEQGPPHRDPRINAFCQQHLQSGGDRLLLIARVGLLEVAGSALMTGLQARLSRRRSAE